MSQRKVLIKNWIFVVVSAVLGAVLVKILLPETSWLAMLGWAIFFISLESVFLHSRHDELAHCTRWLHSMFRADKV
jgi:hypothetical protein